MKHQLPPLESLKVFEAAARHLSFSVAAEELCISKGAVSYQIRKLETHIQATLFNRYTRQVYLTDAGQNLLMTVQSQFIELEKTLSQINAERQHHHISIGATTYVAARWLSPRIAQFNQRYPNIAVVFHHAVNSLNFKLQDVDLAIRWEPHNANNKSHKRLHLAMSLFPVCSPGLLQRIGIAAEQLPLNASVMHTQDFNHLPLLCEDRTIDHWQVWYSTIGKRLSNPQHVISDANVRVQAAIDGQGLIMADQLMQNELDNGLLIPLFKQQLTGYGYTLMRAPKQHYNPNAQLLYEWLSSH